MKKVTSTQRDFGHYPQTIQKTTFYRFIPLLIEEMDIYIIQLCLQKTFKQWYWKEYEQASKMIKKSSKLHIYLSDSSWTTSIIKSLL